MAVTPPLTPNEFDDACLAAVLKESDEAEQVPGTTEHLAEFAAAPTAARAQAGEEPPARAAPPSAATGSGQPDIREQIEKLNGALRGAREELAERDRTRQTAEADRDGQLAELRLQLAHQDEVRRQLIGTQDLLAAMQAELAERDEREAALKDQVAAAESAREQAEAALADRESQLAGSAARIAQGDQREADLRRELKERDDEMAQLRHAFDALKADTDRLLSDLASSLG